MPYIIGTAGHIDHGKTALLHALTGMSGELERAIIKGGRASVIATR